MIEPNTATPTAPPIWRVVSLTADPTPALARGSEPMIESVHGAITFAMPAPIIIVTTITWSTPLFGSKVRNNSSEQVTMRQTGGHDDLVAELLHPHVRQRRADHDRDRLREQHRTRLDGGVPEHGLQVLREQEQRAEQ